MEICTDMKQEIPNGSSVADYHPQDTTGAVFIEKLVHALLEKTAFRFTRDIHRTRDGLRGGD